MESFMNLVASIHSHAERVSFAYYEANRNGMKGSIARSYELLFLGLSILVIAALISSGIGALRAISAFFFASAVYFLIGGILVQEALFCAVAFAFFALLAPWLVSSGIRSTIIFALRAFSAFFLAIFVVTLESPKSTPLFFIAFFALLASMLVSSIERLMVSAVAWFYESTPLLKSAAPSTLPSSSASPPSSNLKPKRSACTPSQISLF
jgi:hypothetical protein